MLLGVLAPQLLACMHGWVAQISNLLACIPGGSYAQACNKFHESASSTQSNQSAMQMQALVFIPLACLMRLWQGMTLGSRWQGVTQPCPHHCSDLLPAAAAASMQQQHLPKADLSVAFVVSRNLGAAASDRVLFVALLDSLSLA